VELIILKFQHKCSGLRITNYTLKSTLQVSLPPTIFLDNVQIIYEIILIIT